MKISLRQIDSGVWVITTSKRWGRKVEQWVRIGSNAKDPVTYTYTMDELCLQDQWYNEEGEEMDCSMSTQIAYFLYDEEQNKEKKMRAGCVQKLLRDF